MENLFIDILGGIWQLIWVILKAFSPVIIGLILAYLLSGPAEWIRLKLFKVQAEMLSTESPRGRVPSILLTYLLVLIILFFILYAFVILIIGALPSEGLQATGEKVFDYFSSSFEDIKAFLKRYIPTGFSDRGFSPADIIAQWIEDKFSLEE